MSHGDWMFLYDDHEETKTRFVSFMGEKSRFDLVIMKTGRFYGKSIVLNIQTNRLAILGHKDLQEEGYLEEAFQIDEKDADELREFLFASI